MNEPTDPRVAAWRRTLQANADLIARQADGVGEEAAFRLLLPDGNHFDWLVGHVIVSRDGILRTLQAEPELAGQHAAAYRRGSSPPERSSALPFAEALARLAAQQQRLDAALAAASPSVLAEPSGFGERSKGEWTDFLVWHDTYHLGQAALYRRVAGLAGILG